MKFTEYLPMHEDTYPRPTRKALSLGWSFWVAVVVAVSAIVLAAMRTAHSFYTAAILSAGVYGMAGAMTQAMGFAEAIAAMLAIEGGLVYGAVKRAQSHGKINPRLFGAYIALLVLISVVAGLGQSLGLVIGLPDSVQATFSWVMALILGAGASIVAWLSGEMLGVEMLRYEHAKSANDKAYQSALTKWTNEARKAWHDAKRQVPREPSERDVHKERVKKHLSDLALRGRVPQPSEVGVSLGISPKLAAQIMNELKENAG